MGCWCRPGPGPVSTVGTEPWWGWTFPLAPAPWSLLGYSNRATSTCRSLKIKWKRHGAFLGNFYVLVSDSLPSALRGSGVRAPPGGCATLASPASGVSFYLHCTFSGVALEPLSRGRWSPHGRFGRAVDVCLGSSCHTRPCQPFPILPRVCSHTLPWGACSSSCLFHDLLVLSESVVSSPEGPVGLACLPVAPAWMLLS